MDVVGQAITSIYDFTKLLAETDGAGATDRLYTSTEEEYGDLVSEWQDGVGSLYHAYDAVGSTEALIDEAQAAVDRYKLRAFGLEV